MVIPVFRQNGAACRRMVALGLLAIGGLSLLTACADDPQASMARSDWVAATSRLPSDPGRLAADKRACQVTAKSTQGAQADSFSDPRYGAVNAMADALGRDSIDETSVKLRQSARFELCMQSRGWGHSAPNP